MSKDHAIRRKPCPAINATKEELIQEPENNSTEDAKIQQSAENTSESSRLVDTGRETLKSQRSSIFGFWKYELLSILGSILSLLAIIVLLCLFDDQDLSRWKSIVSINTFISIFASLFKSAVAFTLSSGMGQLKWIWFSKKPRSLVDLPRLEMASIGPWGCMQLITRQFRGQEMSSVAFFGAALVVLSLAVDPFSQATTSIESCVRILTDPASIPRILSAGYSDTDGPIYDFGLSNDAQLAFLTGIYTPPDNSSVATKVICSSGNCTFPHAFTTLDLCHKCSDISAQIEMINNSTWILPGYNSTVSKNYAMNVYTSAWDIKAQATTSSNRTDSVTKDGMSIGTWLFDFQLLFTRCQGNATATTSSPDCKQAAAAYNCDFTPCVKTYTANVTNHIYAEQEDIAQRKLLDPVVLGPLGDKFFQLVANRTLYNGSFLTCNGSKTDSNYSDVQVYPPESYTRWLDPGFKMESQQTDPSLFYPPACVFEIGPLLTTAMKRYASDLFGGAKVSQPYKGPNVGAAWLQKLWKRGDVNITVADEFARGLATSIGAKWRNSDEAPPSPGNPLSGADRVPGQSFEQRSCIKVRWGFLSFLGVILAGEMVFFVYVVVANLRSPWSGDWKASTLPHVLPYLDEHVERQDQTERDLYKESQDVKAVFMPVNGQWRLKTVPSQVS